MPLIVALGKVDEDLVRDALGPDLHLVSQPSEADFAAAAGAIVRAAYTVDAALLASMPNLRVIARTGVGTERVDVEAARALGIPVVITPGSNTGAVAEGVLALALGLLKRLSPLTNLVREGHWDDRDQLPLGDLDGATCGIIGYGRIGKRVAALMQAFGARVIAFDPFTQIPDELRADSLEELVAASSVITLHVPLTSQNEGMFNSAMFARCKPGTVLINCSRGPLINLNAAQDALESGILGGLGLDVFDEEPAPHHPVFDHPNVLLTPHVMGLSIKAATQTYLDAAAGIRDVLEGRTPKAVA